MEELIGVVGLRKIFYLGARPLDQLQQADHALALNPVLQAHVLLFHVTLFLSNNSEPSHHSICYLTLHLTF